MSFAFASMVGTTLPKTCMAVHMENVWNIEHRRNPPRSCAAAAINFDVPVIFPSIASTTHYNIPHVSRPHLSMIPALHSHVSRRYLGAHPLAVLPCQDPHKNKLYDIRVDEEELSAPVSLGACNGLHSTAGRSVGRRVGEEDVFEGAELRPGRQQTCHICIETNTIGSLRGRMRWRGRYM